MSDMTVVQLERKLGILPGQLSGLAALDTTELAALNGVTAGTALASKVLIVDASKNIGTLGTVTTSSVIFTGMPAYSATNSITAFATGGQGSAVALTTTLNRIGTCATDGDSVKLPAATAGLVLYITNAGVAYANVFPATGEIIDTLAANTAVSLPAGSRATFTCSVAGTWMSGGIVAKAAKYTTNTTTTTFAAGQCSGAAFVVYNNTQGTPGSIAFRTAAQMFADDPYARVGGSYILRIKNGQGTGTLTVTGGATGITLTGTATIGINTFRDFVVTYTSASALVIQSVGTGSDS